MAYNDINCIASLGVTGLAACKDNLGYDAMLIFTTIDFEFASEVSAETEADWQTGIDAKTVFPFPAFEEVEPALEDDVEQEAATGISIFVREGKYGGIGRFQTAICNIANLRTFNEAVGRAFIVTSNGKIYGTSPDGVKFKGFKLSKFHVSMLKGTDGSIVRWIELRYQFSTPTEMGDYPAVPQTTWDPLDKVGLYPTTLLEDDAGVEGLIVCEVTKDCDGTLVTGLVEGDFTILASDGTTEMLPSDGFTDNADGTYDFVFSAPVLPADTYTINLKTAAAQTSGGYEPGTADSFIIP